MPATASYTITYVVQGVVGDPPVDINVYIKENADVAYTLAHTEVNATVGTNYTYTFNSLPSHTVHQVKVESVCDGVVTQFGDIQYLVNPECPVFNLNAVGASIDIDWDVYTPINGDSVLEYVVEYKNVLSLGPYTSITIPIANVLTYWSSNPGSYPNFVYNITTGITIGQTYEVRLSAVLEFDYYLNPPTTSFLSQIEIGPCTAPSISV